eukprot:scaffold11903_cov284-Alexandrium_tamarense.AAC.2
MMCWFRRLRGRTPLEKCRRDDDSHVVRVVVPHNSQTRHSKRPIVEGELPLEMDDETYPRCVQL